MSVGKMQFLTGVSLPLAFTTPSCASCSALQKCGTSERERSPSQSCRRSPQLRVDGSLLDKDSLVHPNDSIVQSSH